MQTAEAQKPIVMKRSITMGEALTISLAIMGTIIGIYVSAQEKMNTSSDRITTMEKNYEKIEGKLDKINDKQDVIRADISDLKAAMKFKQDIK